VRSQKKTEKRGRNEKYMPLFLHPYSVNPAISREEREKGK
jgi:hypothetical protein